MFLVYTHHYALYILIKLDILCDRLEQASVCAGDLILARSARKDLRRLALTYEN